MLHSRISQTGGIRNSRDLLLTAVEAGNSSSGCQYDLVRVFFGVTDVSLNHHLAEVARELCSLFYKEC